MQDVSPSFANTFWPNAIVDRGWLANVPDSFSDEILDRARQKTVEKGQVVYRMGDRPCGLYCVLNGCVAMEYALLERGPDLMGLIQPYGWFGDTEFFDDCDRLTTARATRASTLLFLPRRDLLDLLRATPRAWQWLGTLTSMQHEKALQTIEDLMLRAPQERIVALLLQLANVRKGYAGSGLPVSLDITQSDIARLCSMSRSMVIIHLTDLEERGYIHRAYGRVVLEDIPGLRRLLETRAAGD